MRLHVVPLLTFSALLALIPLSAQATVSSIGDATVNKGQFKTSIASAYQWDGDNPRADHRIQQRFITDYGFTDDFAFGVYLQTDRPGDDDGELDAVMFDARYEINNVKDDGFYSGLRLRYVLKDGDKKPDNAHVKLILGAPLGKWDFRSNAIVSRAVGQDAQSGLSFETDLQATYAWRDGHRIGIESYDDFGNLSRQSGVSAQNHSIGPVAAGKFDNGINYEVGYEAGLSRSAADHAVKFFIGRNF